MNSNCTYAAVRSAYIIWGVLFAAPAIPLALAAVRSSAFYLPLCAVVGGYALACVWLSRFRLTIDAGELCYSSFFAGRRSVPLGSIVEVKAAQRTRPFESPFTVSVKTMSGEEIRINAKVFSREAVQHLFKLRDG